MSRLTVTEKEHWKQRIERRINKAIENLETKDATFMPAIKAKAEREAHVCLGTEGMNDRIDAIKNQRKELEAELESLESTMYTQALGLEAVQHHRLYCMRSDFYSLHGKLSSRIESELLQASPIGREILKLQQEKDSLLDTVWLATSNIHIRDLWNRVSSVVGDEATPLQQQVMTTEPIDS
jgi:seryl-tRNA synthetase